LTLRGSSRGDRGWDISWVSSCPEVVFYHHVYEFTSSVWISSASAMMDGMQYPEAHTRKRQDPQANLNRIHGSSCSRKPSASFQSKMSRFRIPSPYLNNTTGTGAKASAMNANRRCPHPSSVKAVSYVSFARWDWRVGQRRGRSVTKKAYRLSPARGRSAPSTALLTVAVATADAT
jgi:hypothetical protein